MKQLIKKYEDLDIALKKKTFFVGIIRRFETKDRKTLSNFEISQIQNADRNIVELDRIIHKFDNDVNDIILDFQHKYLIQSNKKLSKYASIKTDKKELELLYLYLLICLYETDKEGFLNNASLVFLGILTQEEIESIMIKNGVDLKNNNNKRGI